MANDRKDRTDQPQLADRWLSENTHRGATAELFRLTFYTLPNGCHVELF